MTSTEYANKATADTESWTLECLKDNIFVNLIESGDNDLKKSNKYILQFIDKFRFFRLNSPATYFEIDYKDLSAETIKQLEIYTKGCRTRDEIIRKLDGVIVEVIARIAKQAEPEVLSSSTNEDNMVLVKAALYEIREIVSLRWIFVDGDKKEENKNG